MTNSPTLAKAKRYFLRAFKKNRTVLNYITTVKFVNTYFKKKFKILFLLRQALFVFKVGEYADDDNVANNV